MKRDIFIKRGNIVFIDTMELKKFDKFNDAWTFATTLSQQLEAVGIESIVFTQGGTWLTENDNKVYTEDDIPF